MTKINLPESKYINAKNFKAIGGSKKQAITFTISECVYNERFEKYEISFQENNRLFVLNNTNLKTLCGMYGDDTDQFRYQPISLILSTVVFNGEVVDTIKVVA